MSKGKIAFLAIGMMATGGVVSIGIQSFAQNATTSEAPTAITEPQDRDDNDADVADETTDTVEQEAAEQEGAERHNGDTKHKHASLGNDGVVTGINGTTITIQEEADESGLVYTIDASVATVTKDGSTGKLSDINIGDKIFVKGTVSGTNVTATSIADGRSHGGSSWFGKETETGELEK